MTRARTLNTLLRQMTSGFYNIRRLCTLGWRACHNAQCARNPHSGKVGPGMNEVCVGSQRMSFGPSTPDIWTSIPLSFSRSLFLISFDPIILSTRLYTYYIRIFFISLRTCLCIFFIS